MNDVVDFEARKGAKKKKAKKAKMPDRSIRDEYDTDNFVPLPPSLFVIDAIGSALIKAGINVMRGDVPDLIVEKDGKEYGFTVRPIEQHLENQAVWHKHIIEKHGPELDHPTSDKPLPLSIEEIAVLRSYGYD